jgi:beta-glucosidase/6-phospho-beta-glucosidase/beta-galactosidase
MTDIKLESGAGQFIWAGGIEDTFIPQERPGLRALEEYELTQHYQHWRGDLERAASLGITAMRWGVPWYRVEPQPGRFDWSWTDQVLEYMVRDLGIQPIVDLVHYGTPLWLEDSFVAPDYPQRVAAYAAAFAARYGQLVRYYTPLNEPTLNAEWSGRRGEWPPYLTGDGGYARVLLPIARGIQLSAQTIRAADPDAILVTAEAVGWCQPTSAEARPAAERQDQAELLAWDLVRGAVDEAHPLYAALLAAGAGTAELATLRAGAVEQDVFGVNFYPWSAREIAVDEAGAVVTRLVAPDGRLLAEVLRRCYAHVRRPVMVTETSAKGNVDQRAKWMDETIAGVRALRSAGMPVIGYTWFPLFTMVDWEYRTSAQPLADHLLDLGLWNLRFDERGILARQATPLVAKYREYIAGGL